MGGSLSNVKSMVYREIDRGLRLGRSDMEFDFLGRYLNLSSFQRRIANAIGLGFRLWVSLFFQPLLPLTNEGRIAPLVPTKLRDIKRTR
jgi:hypothetical protein